MKIRSIIFAAVLAVGCCLIIQSPALAAWRAEIQAMGEDAGDESVRKAVAVVGVDATPEANAYPPEPPEYSASIRLYGTDWQGPYKTDVQASGQDEYRWILVVNPSGNVIPPAERTTTLSWDPVKFGAGDFELQEGYEAGGAIVISDMRLKHYYDVTGPSTDKYFTMVYRPDPVAEKGLVGVIQILQILAGIDPIGPFEKFDIDGDGRSGLPEAIAIMRAIAQLR